jgi:hypothetical protein
MKKLLATMVLGIFVVSITTGSTGFAAEKGVTVEMKDGTSFTSSGTTTAPQATAAASGTAAAGSGAGGAVAAAAFAAAALIAAAALASDSDQAHGGHHGIHP